MFLVLDTLKMIRDVRSKGLAIDIWGALLNIPQIIGGLVFIATIEGQVILATVIFTLVVAGQISQAKAVLTSHRFVPSALADPASLARVSAPGPRAPSNAEGLGSLRCGNHPHQSHIRCL
jgi:hypothetical protein